MHDTMSVNTKTFNLSIPETINAIRVVTKNMMDSAKPRVVSPKEGDPPKVMVAQSDFEQVIEAFDTVMDKERRKAREKFKGQDDRMDVDGDPSKEETADAFLACVHTSLKERVFQIVHPIPDSEFHRRTRGPIIDQEIFEEAEEEKFVIAQEQKAARQQEEAERQLEERKNRWVNTDYDHHELIDQNALKRARELRAQVRDLAMKAEQQQRSILDRAIGLAQREIRLLTQDILLEEDEEAITAEMNADKSTVNSARRQLLNQMENSLRTMTSSLSNIVNTEMPRNLRDLRDTVVNIQKSLDKREQPQTLSQTEQAIISRDNEGRHHKVDRIGEEHGDKDQPALIELDEFRDPMNAEFLLADFLNRY